MTRLSCCLLLSVKILVSQPTYNILTRISMIQAADGSKATTFSIDVDHREYWITAKHVITGAHHPPYGSAKAKSVRLSLLQGDEWLPLDFSVLDPGNDIDIVVLAPPRLVLTDPLGSLPVRVEGILIGGYECEFLGYPYGGGWPVAFDKKKNVWLPYVKRCTIAAGPQGEAKYWTLDGINNAGFSGGPVTYFTGERQQVFAVVSGYQTEQSDVVSVPLPPAPPPPSDTKKGRASQAEPRKASSKQVVNVNSGFIIAYDMKPAMDAIRANPIGPLRPTK